MDNTFWILVAFGVFIVIALILFFITKKLSESKDHAYSILQEKFGLSIDKEKYSYTQFKFISRGEFNGIPFVIRETHKKDQDFDNPKTILSFGSFNSALEFYISQENTFIKLGKMFGLKEIEIQSLRLDNDLFFSCREKERFQQLMNKEIKDQFHSLSTKLMGVIKCKNGELTYTISGDINTEYKAIQFEEMIYLFEKLAKQINSIS